MIIRLMREIIDSGIWVFGLFVLALLALVGETGFQIGSARGRTATPLKTETAGVSTLTTGMLAFVAFTLAVTIGIAQDRFEARRHATLEEANTIGTAWLRTGLAGTSGKPIAGLIEEYARGRLAYLTATSPDAATAEAALARTNTLQNVIWQRTLPLLPAMPPTLAAALVSSLNDMFDASLVQRYSMESRVPNETMLGLLLGAVLAVGALGYQMGLAGCRQLVLALLLLLMVSGAMMMIIDFNRPSGGFIHVNPAPLIWTIQGFAPGPSR
jgi:hypothetical protein